MALYTVSERFILIIVILLHYLAKSFCGHLEEVVLLSLCISEILELVDLLTLQRLKAVEEIL